MVTGIGTMGTKVHVIRNTITVLSSLSDGKDTGDMLKIFRWQIKSMDLGRAGGRVSVEMNRRRGHLNELFCF